MHGCPELHARWQIMHWRRLIESASRSGGSLRRDHRGGVRSRLVVFPPEVGLAPDGCDGQFSAMDGRGQTGVGRAAPFHIELTIEAAHAERRLRLSDGPPRGQFT
jgi:hypothetical protein